MLHNEIVLQKVDHFIKMKVFTPEDTKNPNKNHHSIAKQLCYQYFSFYNVVSCAWCEQCPNFHDTKSFLPYNYYQHIL